MLGVFSYPRFAGDRQSCILLKEPERAFPLLYKH
nr:MAG TPA: hypothetical protein [Caudoviricetes sp.]